MKLNILGYLCCPNCSGNLKVHKITESVNEEILDGSLACGICVSSYQVSKGIPILLPKNFSNAFECRIRKEVSENADKMVDKWHSTYDRHHFRTLSQLRIKEKLADAAGSSGIPRVLDIGIGWGVNYLPFGSNIELWGIDFSYESLVMLKKLYERQGLPQPNTICASLSQIPLKLINFDLVWSTQVYQHIPNNEEVKESFSYVIEELLRVGGVFIVDNLNYINLSMQLRSLKRFLRKQPKEQLTPSFYIKYYSKSDFSTLMARFKTKVKYKIFFTENLFHPEFGLRPRSYLLAVLDLTLQRLYFSKFLGRQISLYVKKCANACQ